MVRRITVYELSFEPAIAEASGVTFFYPDMRGQGQSGSQATDP